MGYISLILFIVGCLLIAYAWHINAVESTDTLLYLIGGSVVIIVSIIIYLVSLAWTWWGSNG